MSYPELVHEENYLPDGMSLEQQECPLYNVDSARINASLSVWGLLLFYSPGGGCGIEKSTGPRPLRLIINETGEYTVQLGCNTSSILHQTIII